MYDDILVPTDGGETTETVLEQTIEVAAEHDATIHVLYVVDDGALLTLADQMKEDVLDNLREEGQEAVTECQKQLEAAGFDVVTTLRTGRPASEILAYTETAGIDLVTMGTHGDDYTKNMLGSTSKEVVTNATVPVLTYNVQEEQEV